jgi:hypothetical protein
MKNKITLLVLIFILSNSLFSQNLISNGDFELGPSVVGFVTNGDGYRQLIAPYSGTTVTGDFAITTNPSLINTASFIPSSDHTSGSGRMLVIDGTTTTGNPRFWKAGNTGAGATGLVVGATYRFSFWIKSVSSLVTGTSSQADIGLQTNGSGLTLISGSTQAPLPQLGWRQVVYSFTATATTATIELWNNNTSAVGNDFALDDFSLVACLSPNVTCGITTPNSITFNWVPVTGATGFTNSYQINSGPIFTLPTLSSPNLTVNSLNPGDQVTITVSPVGSGCYNSTTLTCFTTTPCPVPVVSVVQQPTCINPTGTILFTSPLNTVLPIPSNLFISQVTDANSGQLTYIEIYNGTGATVNLANYKIKIYNNGLTTPTCDLALSGSLLNNDVVVIAVGSVTNLGGVLPDLTFAGCGGVNNNDNIRLATIGDVEFDLWGDTTGALFTPSGAAGYSYSRNILAPHPSMLWNPADWTATDWISSAAEDYSGVGNYNYQTANYQYSVEGPTYQVSPTFANLAPNTIYNVTIRDIVGGCTSTPIQLTVNALPVAPATPTITSIVPTCFAAGTSTISNYNSTNTYTFSPATAGISINTSGLISGMIVGTSYIVSASNGSCTSSTSVSFSNAALLTVPATPTITSIVPTCNTEGSSTISNYNSANTYTFTPATAGISINTSGLISGMIVGTNYIVSASNVSCTSSASALFSNAAQLTVPAVPTISSVAPTCFAAGTSTISNYNSTNTYTFSPATAGISINTSGLISGLTIGTSYTVTASAGACTTSDSAPFSNATQLTVPAAPTASVTVQPTCITSAGTIVVTAPTPATNIIYTLTGTNPVVAAVTQSSATFSNLAPGDYNVTTTNTTTGCISTATPLTLDPLPIVVPLLAPYRVCDDNADGIAFFDLTNPQLAIAILGANQLPEDFTISYYLTAAGANPLTNTGETPLPNSYTNLTPYAQTIYIRVVNTLGCFNTGVLDLVVEDYATATGPHLYNEFDNYGNLFDGVSLIDLTTYAPAILNGQNPAIFLVSYYTSLADVQAGTSALTLAEAQAYQTDAYTDTIWVKVENSSNLITPFCYAITTIDISVQSLGINDTEIVPLQFAPNPVKNNLELQSTIVLQSVIIYNVLGQKVYEKIINDTSAILDLSSLKTGSYLVKIDAETGQKVIRIVKE